MDNCEKSNAVNDQLLHEFEQIVGQNHEQVLPDMSACQYLSGENFNMMLQNQLQGLALYDHEEQREITKHYRAMERDVLRSNLRCQEQFQKQRMREIHEEIIQRENAYLYLRLNGNGDGLRAKIVYAAQLHDLQCFRYQGTDEVFFQVTLIEANGGKKVKSPLYTLDTLKIVAKLKRTILAKYEKFDSTKCSSFLWKWLRKKLLSMLDKAEIEEIPAGPGWYKSGDGYHFYTLADEDVTRFSGYMKEFNMIRYGGLEKNAILSLLIDDLEQAGDSGIIGTLLEYRFGALFGRLTKKDCFRFGLVIYGEEAEDVACYFLRTMINEVDKVNLDSDRMGRIREKISALQDTPTIYIVSDLENRSVQNRLWEVMSWMQTSNIEGKRVNAPFVFCFKVFSTVIPLENMLVVDASCINLLQTDQILDKFQCLVIEEIERSGSHWADEIADCYEWHRKNGMCEMTAMVRTIKAVLLRMFNVTEVSEELLFRFRELLEAGETEVENQLSKRTGRISESFKEQVIKLVDGGELIMYDREKAPISGECDYIYFDLKFYYFTETVLKRIGKLAHIDRKSILQIKRELRELSLVKMYRATGYRREEISIDFRICNAYGQCKDLSGMAVLREFWDEVGGIALCERG